MNTKHFLLPLAVKTRQMKKYTKPILMKKASYLALAVTLLGVMIPLTSEAQSTYQLKGDVRLVNTMTNPYSDGGTVWSWSYGYRWNRIVWHGDPCFWGFFTKPTRRWGPWWGGDYWEYQADYPRKGEWTPRVFGYYYYYRHYYTDLLWKINTHEYDETAKKWIKYHKPKWVLFWMKPNIPA